ncbi:pyridoxamine 5'-phosphate oxidase family protein [Parabacteroides sp. AF48-14]|uniref:pyridoxamine 5'-phosphate oxidase family protein n=1 Tax=Parabacteroides sp. AF48-14 TaxID=2292052 RepID=UPI000EFF15D1|nr:pyridoxamine 5'-phosphate oxidase family protein [Parabacteroides sp. AF48-14]RHO69218.1 pyridoxamine 5'-phosphate oxidase family protein [Parabacteroides sp. AF48-14]
MFREIRRKDRVLDEEGIVELLETGEYGFLSMVGTDGFGYGIPISFVKEGESIYFHCAPEGYKLECLRENPKVSFCVVGETRVIPNQFTTAYESALVFGTMQLELSEEECRHALRLLAKKYCSGFEAIGEKYIDKSFHRTNVLRLDIEHISGKCKRIKE